MVETVDGMSGDEQTDWLAIADALAVPVDPEAEHGAWAAQAEWSAQNTRAIMAVVHTLSDEEHALILQRVAEQHPQLRGSAVADWLELADNRDWFVAECELTWERFGKQMIERTQPGVATVVRLATVAAATMHGDDRERLVHSAQRIALDTLEALEL